MTVSPLAGKPAEPSMLVDVPRPIRAYYAEAPAKSQHMGKTYCFCAPACKGGGTCKCHSSC
jgi:hypothetical protein